MVFGVPSSKEIWIRKTHDVIISCIDHFPLETIGLCCLFARGYAWLIIMFPFHFNVNHHVPMSF